MNSKNRRRAAALAGAALASAAATTPTAGAAPYTVTQCVGGAPLTSNFGAALGGALTDACSSGAGAQMTVGNYELSPWGSPWSTAGLRFFVPGWLPNTTITAIDETLSVAPKEGDPSLSFGRIATGGDGTQWGNEFGIPAGHWDGLTQQHWQRSGSPARIVDTYISCYGPCDFAVGPTLTLHAATITLDDSTQPAGATFENTGLLSGQEQHGAARLLLAASDADSGVSSVTLRTAAGTVLASKQLSCVPKRPSPCPQSTGQIEISPVDTTALPDGDWQLEAAVTDFAGNTRVVQLPKITVRNHAPTDSLSNDLSATNGAGGGAASAHLVPSRKRTKATVSFRAPVRVAGTLVDGAGEAIAGATLDAFESVAGNARTKVGEITTDAAGRYSYKANPRANTVLEVVYAPYPGSTTGQSIQTLDIRVQAGVRIKLKRSHIRLGSKVELNGRVLVPGLPRQGVAVEIRVKSGQGWLSGGYAHTDGAGRFHWSHRFTRSRGTFVFWAHVQKDDRMAAGSGSSPTVKLDVG